MPDNKTGIHPLDGKSIDINDSDEIKSWCAILGCREGQLKAVVNKIGTSGKKVRECFGK